MTAETRTRRPRKARVDDRNPFDTPAKRRRLTTLADSSIDRILKGLRAALNLAAARDRLRIRNKTEWDEGLEAISEEIPARKAVLSDAKVGAFIAECRHISGVPWPPVTALPASIR